MKTKTFILLPFIIIALFFSACTQDASQFQPDVKTEKKIKAKVVQFNDSISNVKYAESDDDNYQFWFRRAYSMRFTDQSIDANRHDHQYRYALLIEDKNFVPGRFANKHKVNTLTIAGVTYSSSNYYKSIPDLVLCDEIDYDTFEIIK